LIDNPVIPASDQRMNSYRPTNEIEPEWKEARFRLEAYLRALHLTDQEQHQRIISMVLQRAALKQAHQPGADPTVLAMDKIRELSQHWFESVVQPGERAFVPGLVSWFALDATKKWPGVFLAENVPADFSQNLRECEVRAAPDLKVSRMVPQPFDNPLGDINLPTALGQLTKDLPPSLVTKVAAFVLSGFTLWSGNRLR
jgi:hypothetical protein